MLNKSFLSSIKHVAGMKNNKYRLVARIMVGLVDFMSKVKMLVYNILIASSN